MGKESLFQFRQNVEENIVQEVKGNPVYKVATEPVFTTDPGFVTLTIDDGPSPHTDQILRILARKQARAIFFMIGENVVKYPDVVRKVLEEGHVLGNHSYTHPFMAKLSVEKQKEEMDKANKAIFDATGTLPIYFRPPYGSFNEGTLLTATRENMKVVMWSADPKDYSFNTERAVLRATEPLLASRKILLLHDLKEATVEALPEIIDDAREKNLTITTQYEH